MNSDDLDILIPRWSDELGFVDCGVAPAREMASEMSLYRRAIDLGYHGDMGYLARNMEIRTDPALLLPGVRSVICFLAPYKQREAQVQDLPKIAQYAWGEDYHNVIKDKLRVIVSRMKELQPQLNARVFSDSAPILERLWAREAGLGFIGKNGFLISKKHGIHTLIGVIIVDTELKYSREIVKNGCGKCTRCIDACPTGAIAVPYVMDARKCISYQTIESRRVASEEDFNITRAGYIFGCDICMNACPWGRKGEYTTWTEFLPLVSKEHCKKTIEFSHKEWSGLAEPSFDHIFEKSPLKRAGITKIKDNLDK